MRIIKKIGLCILFFIMLMVTVYGALAITGSDNQRLWINFNDNINDQWNAEPISWRAGGGYSTKYPTFNVIGDGATKSGDFDGDDELNTTTQPDVSLMYDGNDDFTFAFWYNDTTSTNDNTIASSIRTTGVYTTGYILVKESLAGGCAGYITVQMETTVNGDDVAFCQTVVDTSDSTWHHIVISYEGSGNRADWYVDGINRTIIVSAGAFGDLNGNELNRGGNDGRWWVGDYELLGVYLVAHLDNFKIFNKSLTSTEALNLYNYGNITSPFAPVPTITETYSNATEESLSEIKVLFENYNITSGTSANLTYNNTEYTGVINYANNSYVEFHYNITAPFVYLNSTNNLFYWNYTLHYANGTNETGSTTPNNQTVLWNLTIYPRVNVTATDLTDGSAITSFSVADGTKTLSTTTGEIYYYQTSNGIYQLDIDALGYEFASANVTFNQTFYNYDFELFTTNSISIFIKDEDTNLNITTNVSIRFTSNSTEFTNYTTTAGFYIDNLTTGTYELLFDTNDSSYSPRTYTLTVSSRSHQNLNVFLAANTSTTTFTISDISTSQAIEDVLTTMYRFIDGSWQAVESKYTDITGRVQLSYVDDVNYRFFLAKDGYDDYIFYLNPVLYSDYDIQMQPSTVYNLSQDYDRTGVTYAPSYFVPGVNTFRWLIQSPYGELINYGYTITYPGGSNTTSGSNAIGSQLNMEINISGATIWDNVVVDYYYRTTLAGLREFTIIIPIQNVGVGNNTLIKNQDETYGLGIFERVLIATLIIIFIVGIAALTGQIIPGMALGLLVSGLLIYSGFIPFWSFGLTIVIGIFFLMWRSG